MVGCDGCDDWFHFTCLKIPEKYKDLVFSFYCPYCQAGITGPSSRNADGGLEERRTIWKRKCRLSGCFKPCQESSKYCCDEHGEQYVRQAVTQLRVANRHGPEQEQLVKRILGSLGDSSHDFQTFGEQPFADEEAVRSGNPALYDKVVSRDSRLEDLETSQRQLQEETIPSLNNALESLRGYKQWLEDVNNRLVLEKGDLLYHGPETGRQRKKSNGRKLKKTICGFTAHWTTIPCSAQEIVNQFDGVTPTISGVCAKLNCHKHAEWSTIAGEQLTDQLRSLQAHQDRLKLLIRTRKEQLTVQFYEQALLQAN